MFMFFIIMMVSAAAFFSVLMVMVVMMFMFFIIIMMMSAAAFFLIFISDAFDIFIFIGKIKTALHNIENLLAVYLIPVRCNDKCIRIYFVKSVSTLLKFIFADILCTAKYNKTSTLNLIYEEFTEELDVLGILLNVNNSCIGIKSNWCILSYTFNSLYNI